MIRQQQDPGLPSLLYMSGFMKLVLKNVLPDLTTLLGRLQAM